MKIERGDPVRVRLLNGNVVDGVYEDPHKIKSTKAHFVRWGDQLLIVARGWHRFVGPAAVPVYNV